jgi:transposase
MANTRAELLLEAGPQPRKHRRRSKEERRRIVEETLVPGASVARIARAHEVNANQVFHWRKLYQRGLLGAAANKSALLPVRIAEPTGERNMAVSGGQYAHRAAQPQAAAGAIHLELPKARVRIEGAADPKSLRVILECLLG